MKIVQSLYTIGTNLGVEYCLSRAVRRVVVTSEGRATGVELETGETVDADIIVVNADLVYAYRELLPLSSYGQSIQKRGLSCSSISFYWSLSQTVPQLEAHGMFPGRDYGKKNTRIYLEQDKPCNPTFYVHVPSRVDPSAAPPGKDAVIVLVLVEHLTDSGSKTSTMATDDLEKMVSNTREYVLSTIENRTGAARFKELIEHEIVNTPVTWKDKFNSERGSIFGLDHGLMNLLSFRPRTKHDIIDNVYFVGASTHPGAGVPTCLAGAKITAERILKNFDTTIPWDDEKRTCTAHQPDCTTLGCLLHVLQEHIASVAFIVIFAMAIKVYSALS